MGMNLAPSSSESLEISREQVIDAFRKLSKDGGMDPVDLDPENPEVIEANNLFDKWQKQQDTKITGDENAEKRNNFEKTMLFVDAGFTNPNYLGDVLDWLSQDSQEAEKDLGNPSRIQLRHNMAEAIVKIRNLMKSTNG